MRARDFGLLILILVGVLPLSVAGVTAINRAEQTAIDEVGHGNARVAARAARRLSAYVEDQVTKLRTIGAALAPGVHASPLQAERVLKNYRLEFPELRELDLIAVSPDCMEIATSRLDGKVKPRCDAPGYKEAATGATYLSEVELADDFAPLMTVAVPVDAAGERVGVVLARLDLVGIWPAVKEVRVGKSGYARLVTRSGTLVAHGDPRERRRVFRREPDPFAARVPTSDPEEPRAVRYRDSQGRKVIAVAVEDPGLGWKVIVEQPVAEAFGGAARMRRDLVIIMACAVVGALGVGLLFGRAPVRALQRMEKHTREVARGNLEARVPLPRLQELRSLAQAMNDMAGELARLQDEIRAKERLSTFARVAAGLAHDLQTPIESIRGACDVALSHPDDPSARDLLRSAADNHLPRLHRYVRDLRRLAHDGKIPLDFQAINPRVIADQVAADAASLQKWQGVEFVAEGEAAHIWADESLLVRAISNLTGNAADACVQRTPPQGRVCLRVYDTDDQRNLVLEVSDTGVGIAADKLRDLLVHDFKSTKRNSGVGLGLGVARHIAAAHGGVVTADSREGVGSTFRLTIPRHSVSGSSPTNGAARKPPSGGSSG